VLWIRYNLRKNKKLIKMPTPFKKDSSLCDKCQQYGYCIAEDERNKLEALLQKYKAEKLKKFTPLTEREISQWVPIRTTIKDASTKFGKKLQQAHELFHQDEFEQASYMYQDMLETRNDCDEVMIGLAASFYFLKKYEEASSVAIKINDSFHNKFPYRFTNCCEIKLNELAAEMVSKNELDDTETNENSDTTLLNKINSII